MVLFLQYLFISEILKMRAIRDPDHVIFTLVNAKGGAAATLTCSQLHKRAEKVSNLLNERAKVNTGDHVALIFPPGIDLICAFYGCLYVGKIKTIETNHNINNFITLVLNILSCSRCCSCDNTTSSSTKSSDYSTDCANDCRC